MCAQKPLTEDKLLTILALFFQQNILSINMAASGSKLHFILRVLTEYKITFLAISLRIFVFFQKHMHVQIFLSLEVATLKYAEEEITGNSCQNNRTIICHKIKRGCTLSSARFREAKQWTVWNVWFKIWGINPNQMSCIWFLHMFQLGLKRSDLCQISLSVFCVLAKALVHWQSIELSAILVKKNEDKAGLVTLKEILRMDIWKKIYLRKKVVKDYITESVGGKGETSGYTNTRKQAAIWLLLRSKR